ncbi:MAG: hypothetical protein GX483_08625 [Actinomycetaceae bacterium]|nr:hypothetical protein [Actinomycetaceae bacterium]
MKSLTFIDLNVSTLLGLDRLGLIVDKQAIDKEGVYIRCRQPMVKQFCYQFGCVAVSRGSEQRRLAHVSIGAQPSLLLVSVRRMQRTGCGRT